MCIFIIRGLLWTGEVEQAKALMISHDEDAFREGFTRDREFPANCLDSRTIIALRLSPVTRTKPVR